MSLHRLRQRHLRNLQRRRDGLVERRHFRLGERPIEKPEVVQRPEPGLPGRSIEDTAEGERCRRGGDGSSQINAALAPAVEPEFGAFRSNDDPDLMPVSGLG